MTPETEFKATPDQIARIASTAIRQLAETHVIITKEELRDIISESIEKHSIEMWDLVLNNYHETGIHLAGVIPPEQLKGYQIGENLLHRMKSVIEEENAAVFSPKSEENPPKTV